MNKSEAIITRLENQIEEIFNTILEIEKLEQKEPIRKLSDWHETALWMVFMWQVLIKNCWHTRLNANLTQEQRLKYIEEVWNMTYEHYLNLYWYNARKLKD